MWPPQVLLAFTCLNVNKYLVGLEFPFEANKAPKDLPLYTFPWWGSLHATVKNHRGAEIPAICLPHFQDCSQKTRDSRARDKRLLSPNTLRICLISPCAPWLPQAGCRRASVSIKEQSSFPLRCFSCHTRQSLWLYVLGVETCLKDPYPLLQCGG